MNQLSNIQARLARCSILPKVLPVLSTRFFRPRHDLILENLVLRQRLEALNSSEPVLRQNLSRLWPYSSQEVLNGKSVLIFTPKWIFWRGTGSLLHP